MRRNRWVKLAQLVPWKQVQKCYAKGLAGTGMGAPAKSARIAFGALLIKERLGISDEETVEQIIENPYLQYFLGLHVYTESQLFDASMMVHFRKRFTAEDFGTINEQIVSEALEAKQEFRETEVGNNCVQVPPLNKGKLLVDATCAPADITYPTDLNLLNEAREKTERVIDRLYAPIKQAVKKPRTYRRKARKIYLQSAKSKKLTAKKCRTAIGKQLRFIRRNLKSIDTLIESGASMCSLSTCDYKSLLVVNTLYAQQLEMYETRTHRVDDRIVSISQPHVRPIVRGKASAKVEFGAKLSVSCVEGYTFVDHLSWDSFNESTDLIPQIEAYHERFGHYPESVHADAIYRTRANRKYCKDHDIRISGPALGRPPKQTEQNKEILKALKAQAAQDERDRIPIEGKFGNAKRRGGLALIMAKLANTSVSVINIAFIVMNLDTALRRILLRLFYAPACFKKYIPVSLNCFYIAYNKMMFPTRFSCA